MVRNVGPYNNKSTCTIIVLWTYFWGYCLWYFFKSFLCLLYTCKLHFRSMLIDLLDNSLQSKYSETVFFSVYIWTGWDFLQTVTQTHTFVSICSIIGKYVLWYHSIWVCTLAEWMLYRLYQMDICYTVMEKTDKNNPLLSFLLASVKSRHVFLSCSYYFLL